MPSATEGGRAVRRSGGQWLQIARVIRRIVGAPDYEAYLEHCRRTGHAPRLTKQQYVDEFFEAKGAGVRCC